MTFPTALMTKLRALSDAHEKESLELLAAGFPPDHDKIKELRWRQLALLDVGATVGHAALEADRPARNPPAH